MPLYEYMCQICANSFDRLRPADRRDEQTGCPDCGGESMRQLSVFASFSTGPGGETSAIAGGGGGCCGGGSGSCACSMTV